MIDIGVDVFDILDTRAQGQSTSAILESYLFTLRASIRRQQRLLLRFWRYILMVRLHVWAELLRDAMFGRSS
jgi:hypothetical protein